MKEIQAEKAQLLATLNTKKSDVKLKAFRSESNQKEGILLLRIIDKNQREIHTARKSRFGIDKS